MSKCRNFMASFLLAISSATADTEFAVAHGLRDENGTGVIPSQAFVCRRNSNFNVYLGTTAWTSTNAYLKCDTGSVQFYIIFFA